MKTFTNSFSFNRFKSVFCWLLVLNRNSIINILIGTALATLVFEGIMLLWQVPFDVTVSVMALVFFIGTSVLASKYLSCVLDHKSNRIQFLAMPANNHEKFFAAISLFCFKVLGVIIAISIGDFIRYLVGGMGNGLFFNYLHGGNNVFELLLDLGLIFSFWILLMGYRTAYTKFGSIMFFIYCGVLLIPMIINIPAVIETHSLYSLVPSHSFIHGMFCGFLPAATIVLLIFTLIKGIQLNDKHPWFN